jgi:hypothetical protein|tara:strand:+ start:697 stop:960 length:264 start_codon:yes stop_codon:yes gene_type:complete
MSNYVPRALADRYLEPIVVAYHATVEAFMRLDPDWMAEGLWMLEASLQSALEAVEKAYSNLNPTALKQMRLDEDEINKFLDENRSGQ